MMIKHKEPSALSDIAPDSFEAILPDLEAGFTDKDGNDIGPPAGLSWVRPVPWGFGKLLSQLYERYGWDIYM